MSHTPLPTAPTMQRPRRALRADFTARTMRQAAIAKRRATKRHNKKEFFMQPFTFLRTVPGAALIVAIIAATGVGAYAVANWFNGAVTVTQDSSILTVDLSQCKGNLPAGVAPTSNRSGVQFKILGNPHIAADQLQQRLLAQCEYNAIADFYKNNTATKSDTLYAGIVKANDGQAVTLDYQWAGQTNHKTFALGTNTTLYNQGKPVAAQDITAGNTVVFVVHVPTGATEGTDPLANVTALTSIFKTQYNTTSAPETSKNGFYEQNNIMPLDWYNQLHK